MHSGYYIFLLATSDESLINYIQIKIKILIIIIIYALKILFYFFLFDYLRKKCVWLIRILDTKCKYIFKKKMKKLKEMIYRDIAKSWWNNVYSQIEVITFLLPYLLYIIFIVNSYN